MKSIHALMCVAAFSLAGSAIAGGGPYPEPAIPGGESVKSRAEVLAEVRDAQSRGLMTLGEEDVRVAMPEQPAKSRAEVVAETREAQRLGLLTLGEEDVRIASSEQAALIAAAGHRVAEQVHVAAQGSGRE